MADYTGQPVEKIEEDTDRDRYMSPLESKEYGLIDEIIGGDDAGIKIDGSLLHVPKTKREYISWGEEEDDDESRGARFVKPRTAESTPLSEE